MPSSADDASLPRPTLEERVLALRERLQGYIATMVADWTSAQDLCQETMLRALDRLATLRDEGRLEAWTWAIAVNVCRAHLRRAVQDEKSLDFDPVSRRGSVLSSIVRRESAAALAVAIDRLPILLREAFVLRDVERMPYTEMAEITGACEGALQVRVHRAHALLRRQLGPLLDPIWSGEA